MKSAVALFVGIFASGLALGSFVEPTYQRVACRTYYTFASAEAGTVQVEGPQLSDSNADGKHKETFVDEKLGTTLSFEWDEASNFRDLYAKVQVFGNRGLIEAATYGKPLTAVHLTDLNLELSDYTVEVIRTNEQKNVKVQSLTGISLYCGISTQY